VKGPDGVIGYLGKIDEQLAEAREKGEQPAIDPRGGRGFRDFYLSFGVPAVLKLKDEGTVDFVPRSVELVLSISNRPFDRQIKKLVQTEPGDCVTSVILTLAANNLPNPFNTGEEKGNNPIGLAAQLVRDFGYHPVKLSDSPPVKIKSRYGEFEANILTREEFIDAASKGKIPPYAIVFQTRHPSWVEPSQDGEGSKPATSVGSRGFDAAVAVPTTKHGRNAYLWNGRRNDGDPPLIYGDATRGVFVLVYDQHEGGNGDRQVGRDVDPIKGLMASRSRREGHVG
jgi:hypothetical protein